MSQPLITVCMSLSCSACVCLFGLEKVDGFIVEEEERVVLAHKGDGSSLVISSSKLFPSRLLGHSLSACVDWLCLGFSLIGWLG